MIGRTLSHYTVLEKIGTGGMGEVYRARDQRLERDVALKILPLGAVPDERARKGFRKEALALSRLNHPNIATVLDFDSQGEIDFLVMEFVSGEGVAEKIRGGPLAERELARLGADLAEGMGAAHAQGVIHRDLKPGNLRLTPDGRLKILDFGLAQLLESSPTSPHDATETLSTTGTGMTAGTLPYMAPERLRGEKADARSDIWAAGLVLYEMATGRRAFPDGERARLITAILHEPPPSPTSANRRITLELENIITKCLEKDPENRYQSARELAIDLRRLGSGSLGSRVSGSRSGPSRSKLLAGAIAGTVAALVGLFALNVGGVRHRLLGIDQAQRITSLAVLPLENLSGDPNQEYFAEGMTEQLTSSLGKIGGLRVISRSSVEAFQRHDTPLPKIAHRLGVDALVEGSVARSGGRVRVTASLVGANPERQLWSDHYVRDVQDILSVQEDIAAAIAQRIRAQVTTAAGPRARGAVDPSAYEAYLRGRFELSHIGVEPYRRAVSQFKRAVEIQPDFAQAWVGLADAYYAASSAYLAPEEAMPKVRDAARAAIKLDPELAEGHAALGVVASQFDWDWGVAEREYRESIRLNPSYANARLYYAFMLVQTGRFGEAISEVRVARQLDPLSESTSSQMAWVYYWAGKLDSTTALCKAMIAAEPNAFQYRFLLARCYWDQGFNNKAISEARSGIAQSGDSTGLLVLASAYARAGRRHEAVETFNRWESRLAKGEYRFYFTEALFFALLGDKEMTFRCLQAAYESRDENIGFLRSYPELRWLRSEPRYDALLRRLRLTG